MHLGWIARLLIASCAVLMVAAPAQAHRLRVFATVEDGAVSGFAFFVGSGRAQGADIAIKSSESEAVEHVHTDDEGRFVWRPPAPATFHIVASTGDGHVSETTIDKARFGGSPPAREAMPSPAGVEPAVAPATGSEEFARLVEQKVDAAVARQIRPLLESYAAAESRLRFNDIMGGVGMIFGFAGIALWISSRRRPASARRRPASDDGQST